MHCSHCRSDFVEDVASLLLREVVLVNDYIEQFPPLAVFRYDVLVLCLFKYFVNLEDAGVILRVRRNTMRLRRETSLRVMVLALGNLKVLIFLMALRCPVD